ncbi:hypothetical protein [Aquifex sp.]
MSIRHQMRQRVEKYFKPVVEKFGEGELKIYAIFVPKNGEIDEESIDIFERSVNLSDAESVEKFYSVVTKVALENDVKDLELYGYAVEKGENLKIIAPNRNEEIEEIALEIIERMREEA